MQRRREADSFREKRGLQGEGGSLNEQTSSKMQRVADDGKTGWLKVELHVNIAEMKRHEITLATRKQKCLVWIHRVWFKDEVQGQVTEMGEQVVKDREVKNSGRKGSGKVSEEINWGGNKDDDHRYVFFWFGVKCDATYETQDKTSRLTRKTTFSFIYCCLFSLEFLIEDELYLFFELLRLYEEANINTHL